MSVRTRVYSGAEKFVDELHRRWTARRKPGEVIPLGAAPQRFLPPEREMPDNAVFISYAREDLPAVQKLKAGLDAAGITTWFDLERLEGGDDYDRKIQRNIARCSFFIPIVSATTQRRLEGYFRREWSYAIDRARNIADGAVFILPVCIDDTDASATRSVPDKFKAVHFTRLPGRRGHRRSSCGASRDLLVRAGRDASATRAPCSAAAPPRGLDALDRRRRSTPGSASPRSPRRRAATSTAARRRSPSSRRRVQRKLLTILFGQSGLGKTSILRAGHRAAAAARGLLPGLRAHRLLARFAHARRADQAGDLPRDAGGRALDAGRASPSRASRCGSSCTTATTCCATPSGKTLIPLLIFDQFEEIFTLAQSDDFGRQRAAQFLEDLADLVENRAPKALEARIDSDDAARRALRLRPRRLPHPDRAARGLPRAPRGPEGRDALDHAEPDAARADDRRSRRSPP